MNRSHSPLLIRRHRLCVAMFVALMPAGLMAAPGYEFDADLLHGGAAGSLDLSRFDVESAHPGVYSADIELNGTRIGRMDVELREGANGEVTPCVDPGLFELIELDHKRLRAAMESATGDALLPLPQERSCQPLSSFIPNASLSFDTGEQILAVSIPQIYVLRTREGWVDPSSWDNGINAALFNYSASHNRYQGGGRQEQQTSASISAGLNLGAWRVRHDGYFNQVSAGSHYTASRSYVQRELRSLGSQLTVGGGVTAGDLFDSISYTGFNVQTDPRMVPSVLASYAPVVRGVAQTNAKVTISQRGYVIHEVNVAPGPFEIDDLQNSSSSGDLEVTVTEADGRVERFTIPYAAVPHLLREGQQRASLTIGELRDNQLVESPRFLEASLRRGVSSRATVFGGGIVAKDYRSMVLGAAVNTRIGAFSGDVTLSDAHLRGDLPGVGDRARGQSYRLTYSRSFNDATSFSLAAYRYSTEGFLSLSDAARLQDQFAQGGAGQSARRQRSRMDLTINHRLQKGSLYFNGSTADYWSEGRRTTNFSLGYSGQWRSASYNISARRTLESSLFSGAQKQSTGAYLSISMPLGKASAAPRLTSSATSDRSGNQYRAGVTGMFGKDRQGQYNASLSQGRGQRDVSAGVSYETAVGTVGASWNHGQGNQQFAVNASGGMVVHGGGLVLSQSLGDTVALVHVPGAKGARVHGQRGVKTNRQGYAAVSQVSAYRRNEVVIDPSGLPLDVELTSGSVVVVPTAGAIVRAVVPTAGGRSALLEVMRPEGAPLPFGVDVTTAAGEVVGVVGQGNRLWVRGIEERGYLLTQADTEGNQCRIDYNLEQAQQGGLMQVRCAQSGVTPRSLAGDVALVPRSP